MTHFVLYKKTKGPFKGQKTLALKGTNSDKTTKLSITNSELRGDGDKYRDEMVENPNNKFCVVRLYEELKRRYEQVQPGYCGRVFRRRQERGTGSSTSPT